jgi:glycosyl transferase family 1
LSKRVCVIIDLEGWAYERRARILQKYAAPGWVVTYGFEPPREPVDLILLLNLQALEGVMDAVASLTPRPKVIGAINAGWPRRVELIGPLLDTCDHLLFINREYFLKVGSLPRTHWISHGVDTSCFRPKAVPRSGLVRVLWIGSTNHAEVKGYWEILQPLSVRLQERRIETDFRLVDARLPTFSPDGIVEWYHSGEIYVVASRSEGTPNPALEAAASGLVVVGTPVGVLPELIVDRVNGVLVAERSVSAFVDAIEYGVSHRQRLVGAMQETIRSWDWQIRAAEYFGLFDAILNGSAV